MTFPVEREIYTGIFDRGLPTLDSPVVGADTDTLTRPVEQEDDGGHDRFAHYIKKEKIVESAVTGKSFNYYWNEDFISFCEGYKII